MSLEEPQSAEEEPKWAAKHVGEKQKKQPWEDVELGPLIGQGSFGKVYRGIWNGAPVAVKVRARMREGFAGFCISSMLACIVYGSGMSGISCALLGPCRCACCAGQLPYPCRLPINNLVRDPSSCVPSSFQGSCHILRLAP